MRKMQALVLLVAASTLVGAAAAAPPRDFLTEARAGDAAEIGLSYVKAHLAELGLTSDDLTDVVVSDRYQSAHNGLTHVYLQQRLGGIRVHGAILNFNVARDGRLLNVGSTFVGNLRGRVEPAGELIAPEAAVDRAAAHLGVVLRDGVVQLSGSGGSDRAALLSEGGVSRRPIPVKLVYQPREDGRVRLAWDLSIDLVGSPDWWQLRVDAATGEVLDKNNWTSYDSYLVSPFNFESLGHSGGQSTATNPANATASPFGWHDTNGTAGAEFTDTRGNNVSAQEDTDANNSGGTRPSGGAGNDYAFAYDEGEDPETGTNQSAAIVNLFYWNNLMHDITYQYGFDEAGGNFQTNNYGNGGLGNDAVQADAQDGNGTNNANFATPADGSPPRMQMFRWVSPPLLTVNSPVSIAGDYDAAPASFGTPIDFVGLTDDVELVNDGDDEAGAASVTDACQDLVGFTAGRIALIDRGTCEFGVKVLNAEEAGAVAAIIVNNQGDVPVPMGPGAVGGLVTIPSVMIGQSDGGLLKDELPTPGVNVTMVKVGQDRDSDFDNGVIAHEFGHGVSNRLTGGPAQPGCLSHQEQGGEGWSDFWAVVLTAKATDTPFIPRGIGNYVNFDPLTGGFGIRNFPYTVDMNVNPQTYADVGTTNIPHGVGEIWFTALWEVYWELVTRYGFDPDLYNGDGGNNLLIQLVVDGMKLQPCSPTFTQARDAIVSADVALTGGLNACPIWAGFAKRGLGFSAASGSAAVGDETEAFDLPPAIAATCQSGILFKDGFESGNVAAWSNTVP